MFRKCCGTTNWIVSYLYPKYTFRSSALSRRSVEQLNFDCFIFIYQSCVLDTAHFFSYGFIFFFVCFFLLQTKQIVRAASHFWLLWRQISNFAYSSCSGMRYRLRLHDIPTIYLLLRCLTCTASASSSFPSDALIFRRWCHPLPLSDFPGHSFLGIQKMNNDLTLWTFSTSMFNRISRAQHVTDSSPHTPVNQMVPRHSRDVQVSASLSSSLTWTTHWYAVRRSPDTIADAPS